MSARNPIHQSLRPRAAWAGALPLLLLAASAAGAAPADQLTERQRLALEAPVRERIGQVTQDPRKRAAYSRDFHRVDDSTYQVTLHVDAASEADLTTDRLLLTLKRDPAKADHWTIASEEPQDHLELLHREAGFNCYPFDRFSFEREGLRMSASKGWVCERYYQGAVAGFQLLSADMRYDYAPPEYVQDEHVAIFKILKKDKASDLFFPPEAMGITCDPETCEELFAASFTGLARVPASERSPSSQGVPPGMDATLLQVMDRSVDVFQIPFKVVSRTKMRAENPFAEFRIPYEPGRRTWAAGIYRNDKHLVALQYDNWGGYEVTFNVVQNTPDPEALNGLIFGYYTKGTYDKTTPYQREQRDDEDARWHEVYSLKGDVDLALADPEVLTAKLDFGLVAKQDLDSLEFEIQSLLLQGGADTRKLDVNSIQLDGQELTWVKTRPIAGRVFFPHTIQRGTKFTLRVDFACKALYQVNYAFTAMSRFGWMPFVRFADFIDDFEMTIRSPAKYQILGVGHKVSEKVEGDVLVSHWKAESPVVFPTIIFGRYQTDEPDYQAKKLDGTPIPVAVHVDEASFTEWGIRPKQLRPIATQAAVSLDLYKELSGIDYPYGEMNLVNDFAGGFYGQSPSSLIYLGSPVFRSTSSMGRGAGTSLSKFLKSVVAHEVGHQWWGSRVSNANTRNYWFVETLAEYFSALYLEQAFGKKEYQEQVDEWRRAVLDTDEKTSVQNASTHWAGNTPGRSYQTAVYSKGPYMFHILRQTFGDEKFFPYLKQFSQQLAGMREIVSRDIQDASEKFLGGVSADGTPYNPKLEWFFDQWLRGVGLPQYRLQYDVRQAESGEWIVEGTIQQRIVVGNKTAFEVLPGRNYRGLVDLTVLIKGGKELRSRVRVENAETPFRFTVPDKPLEVALNKYGGILAYDAKVNAAW